MPAWRPLRATKPPSTVGQSYQANRSHSPSCQRLDQMDVLCACHDGERTAVNIKESSHGRSHATLFRKVRACAAPRGRRACGGARRRSDPGAAVPFGTRTSAAQPHGSGARRSRRRARRGTLALRARARLEPSARAHVARPRRGVCRRLHRPLPLGLPWAEASGHGLCAGGNRGTCVGHDRDW